MKRLLLVATTVAIGWLGAGQASADVPQVTTGSDDAVCVAVRPVLGLCQGNPVPGLAGVVHQLPRP